MTAENKTFLCPGFSGMEDGEGAATLSLESSRATRALGAALAKRVAGEGLALGLCGPLGVGKTELVRGFAEALGVPHGEITSPTYVLEHIYEVKDLEEGSPGALHHWDLYRIEPGWAPEDLVELLEIPSRLVLVEWSERMGSARDLLDAEIVLDFCGMVPSATPTPIARQAAFHARSAGGMAGVWSGRWREIVSMGEAMFGEGRPGNP